MWVSKDSVNKRINLDIENEKKIDKKDIEKRWFKKWNYRKYNDMVKKRIVNLYHQMIDEKTFFINKYTIFENYKKLYIDDKSMPTIHYVEYIMKTEKLRRRRIKPFRNWLSKYMNYPENTINNLWNIILWIDFVWPRFLEWDNTPYYFLSRRYIRPEKYWMLDVIGSETTKETITMLLKDWKDNLIPDVVKIDNDSAFGMLKSWKHKKAIWTFIKFLLYLWITPLFSVPRSPWNNWSVEWQNSVFNKLFWQAILFDSPKHLRTEITRFNTEYKQYSNLIWTTNLEQVWIKQKYINDIEKERKIDIDNLSNIEWLKELRKKDLPCKQICILRKVERIWEKKWDNEMWEIKILWENIIIWKEYINLILFCRIDIEKDSLEICLEKEWKLEILKEKKFVIKNI